VTAIKRSQIRTQLDAWTEAGRAPTTINHRRRALADVLTWALKADDDDDVVVPTDGIDYLPARRSEARGIPMPILVRILAALSDRGSITTPGANRPTVSKTKVRLRVMAWTGLAHMSLVRLDRRRVNLTAGKMLLPERKKGAGADGVWIDLLPPAIDALRDFDRAGLWGQRFSRSSMRKAWIGAVAKTRKQLVDEAAETNDRTMLDQFEQVMPSNPYPYDTRHSFLTDAYRQSKDILAVQRIGQHASIETTQRYTKGAVPEAVARAIDKMRARWFPETPKPGATVRDFHLVTKGS
jgi:integrase